MALPYQSLKINQTFGKTLYFDWTILVSLIKNRDLTASQLLRLEEKCIDKNTTGVEQPDRLVGITFALVSRS